MYKAYLVINRTNGDIPQLWHDKIQEFGLGLLGTLPDDPTVAQFDVVGRPIIEVGEDTPIFRAVAKIAGDAGIR